LLDISIPLVCGVTHPCWVACTPNEHPLIVIDLPPQLRSAGDTPGALFELWDNVHPAIETAELFSSTTPGPPFEKKLQPEMLTKSVFHKYNPAERRFGQ
jgi:hypothetical protein